MCILVLFTVNNVGVLLSEPQEFGDVSEKDIWSHINVNVASVPAMTKLVLPGMLRRGRGAIVNVSSITSLSPFPMIGIYSATKVRPRDQRHLRHPGTHCFLLRAYQSYSNTCIL